jgi:hypothetical protein
MIAATLAVGFVSTPDAVPFGVMLLADEFTVVVSPVLLGPPGACFGPVDPLPLVVWPAVVPPVAREIVAGTEPPGKGVLPGFSAGFATTGSPLTYVYCCSGLAFMPLMKHFALIVDVLVTVMGPAYAWSDSVGIWPLIV